LLSDEPRAFERHHHLVNRRGTDAEIFLHVSFGRRPPVQARIGVDKRQILTLPVGESLCGGTQTGHPIGLCIQASSGEEAGMNVRYRVELSQAECEKLTGLLSGGQHSVRKLKRARILLTADAGVSDEAIANSTGVGGSTVYRTKRRFVLGNLEAAPSEEPRAGAARKSPGKKKPCWSRPPSEGRARCTLELLPGELVKFAEHGSMSRGTMCRRLAENDLKPWRKDTWCIPQVDGEYVARMEDVLDLYAERPDPKRPVVCFDESPLARSASRSPPAPACPNATIASTTQWNNLFVVLDAGRH
jgi:transposase